MSKNSITGTFPNFSSSLLRVVKLVSNKIGGRLHEDFGTAHAHLVSFEVSSIYYFIINSSKPTDFEKNTHLI